MNYEEIKRMAKQSRDNGQQVTVKDLIALAPQNDPFYVGTPTEVRNAEWFAEIWQRFGYTSGIHLRRVHYAIVSQQQPVKMPNGTPYENTKQCWDFLEAASKPARYLGYVAPEKFEDKRNPGVYIHANRHTPQTALSVQNTLYWDAPELPEFPALPGYNLTGYEGEQRYTLEVWCEKSTMNDVLQPLCSAYGANLQTGLGELSITSVLRLVERNTKPTRIFYISDFDPAGQSMPVAVARKIEYFTRNRNEDIDIQLFPVALTLDQVKGYQLPRTPIKESERRAGRFEERHGDGAVELDALETLYPGELARLVRTEFNRYYDHTLRQRVAAARQAYWNEMEQARAQITARYQDDIDDLASEYAALRAEFAFRMARHTERLGEVWAAIEDDLRTHQGQVSPEEHPVPTATTAEERGGALYDSARDYLDQLAHYKEFQGKPLVLTGGEA